MFRYANIAGRTNDPQPTPGGRERVMGSDPQFGARCRPTGQESRSAYWSGARAVAPLGAAIGALGVLFGYVARSTGLTSLAAVVMSATTFAGSAQFAAVSILGASGTVAAAVGAATLLNARYAAMGIALVPALQGRAWVRLLLAQLAVDESWAVAYVGEGRFSRERLVGSGLLLYAVHVSATAVGAAAHTVLRDPSAWGLDAALPALFVALLQPLVSRREGLVAAALGATIALALTPFASPGIPILAAASVSLVGLRSR